MIKIDPSSYIPAATALVQRALIFVLGYLGMTGFLNDSDISKIASGVVSLGLIVWGAIKAYRKNEEKKTMEPYVPDAIASLKGK